MKKFLLAAVCTAVAAGLAPRVALADEFTFTIPGTVDAGSGFITANPVAGHPGEFIALNMTGQIGGQFITYFYPAGTYPAGQAANDNLLFYPPSAQTSVDASVDLLGISFQLQNGQMYNLYYGSFATNYPVAYNIDYGPNLEFNDIIGGFNLVDLTPSAPTPEPGSLLLLGTGALGVAGMARRRFMAARLS